jgi:hypothetical protein
MHSSPVPYVPICFAHLFPFGLIISVKRRKIDLHYRTVQCHCAESRKVAGSIRDGVIGIFIDIMLPAALWPWGDSNSNRNEYQEYFLGVKAASA